MSKIERLRHVPLGAWLVLAVVIASIAGIVIKAPPEMWAALAAADVEHVAGVIGLVGAALALAIARVRAAWQGTAPPDLGLVPGPRPWERPGYDDEDPTPALSPRAIDRRDRAPGDSARPRSRREGSADVLEAGVLAGIVVLVALVAALSSGCGASAVQVHATSATLATHAATAARAELLRAVDARIAECRASAEPTPCLDESERLYREAGVALDAAVMAIADYRELIEVAHLAEDQDVVVVVLTRAKAHAASQWSRALELATALGADLPTQTAALAAPGGAR